MESDHFDSRLKSRVRDCDVLIFYHYMKLADLTNEDGDDRPDVPSSQLEGKNLLQESDII